jgi:hypothetical protein
LAALFLLQAYECWWQYVCCNMGAAMRLRQYDCGNTAALAANLDQTYAADGGE